MKANEFCFTAAKIMEQRGQQNGYDKGEERSAAKIARVFNALTGRDLTEAEAWTFMICLKLVRQNNKHQDDNIVDLAAYAGLLGECESATAEQRKLAEDVAYQCASAAPVRQRFTINADDAPGDGWALFKGGKLSFSEEDETAPGALAPVMLTAEQVQQYIDDSLLRAVQPGGIMFGRRIDTGNHPVIE